MDILFTLFIFGLIALRVYRVDLPVIKKIIAKNKPYWRHFLPEKEKEE